MIKKGLSGTDFLDQTCSKSVDLKNADPRTKMDEPKKIIINCMGHTTQPRVMASTLLMRTAISPEQP